MDHLLRLTASTSPNNHDGTRWQWKSWMAKKGTPLSRALVCTSHNPKMGGTRNNWMSTGEQQQALLRLFDDKIIHPGNWHVKERLKEIWGDPNRPFACFSFRVFQTHVNDIKKERQREIERGEGVPLSLSCFTLFHYSPSFPFLSLQTEEVASLERIPQAEGLLPVLRPRRLARSPRTPLRQSLLISLSPTSRTSFICLALGWNGRITS